ncbi:MAG: serine protease [Byssovorax sp.]
MPQPARRFALVSLVSLVSLVALSLAACSGNEIAPAPAKAPVQAPAAKVEKARPPIPAGHLYREDVDQALTSLGLPWLFRRVMREGAFSKDGRFTGWLITGLPEEWSAIDLKPGDVVQRVNGKTLETPEDAWEAWKSVARAKEIKLSLERNGAPKELAIPIDGDPTPEVAKALDQDAPASRAQPKPEAPRTGVVRIGGDPPAGGDWQGDDAY